MENKIELNLKTGIYFLVTNNSMNKSHFKFMVSK